MASLQAKMGGERLRKREKKKLSFRSLPTLPGIENFKKNSKKLKNIVMVHFKPKQVGRGRVRGEKEIIVPINSYLTRNSKFQKIAKKFEKLKNIFMAYFHDKTWRQRLRKRGKKNYRSDP